MGVVLIAPSNVTKGIIAPSYSQKIEALADPIETEYNINGVKVIVK